MSVKQENAPLNIYQKMAKIRKPIEVLVKNKEGYGYKYVSEDVILAKITGLMEKYHISLIPSISPLTIRIEPHHYVKTKFTKNGTQYDEHVNEIIVDAEMVWHWVNNDDPTERISVPWALVGQQSDASQAFGSGLSYASRYFMLKYFNVATSNDDPDHWRAIQKEAEVSEDRAIAQKIIEQLHQIVVTHIEQHPEARDKIYEITRKYARDKKGKASINYNTIEDPAVASELLKEIQAFTQPV